MEDFRRRLLGEGGEGSRTPELSENSNSEEDPALCGGFENSVNGKMKSGLRT